MEYHLAQVNVGRILAPMDSLEMAEFKANLDPINALAEQSEGFIWRLTDESNNATSIPVTEDRFLLVNMSVWRTIDDLFAFTYRSAHTEYVRRRAEWFERMKEMFMCCWYVPAGHVPTVAEALERIAHIREQGPTPYAFTFKKRFAVTDMHQFFMDKCAQLAQIAAQEGESAVGSVLVKDGRIFGTGYEKSRQLKDISRHAEMVAILDALQATNDLSGSTLYSNAEPCILCSYAIRHHKIGTVVFSRYVGELGGTHAPCNVLTASSFTAWGPPPEIVVYSL